ncbi:MAG: proline racemase family protein, partial [Pirellulaceae bacterium]
MERQRFRAIDSHTGGEPTRLVVEGVPDWPGLTMEQCRERLKSEADFYRTMLTREPRGSEVMVGGVLFPPADPKHTAGVVFFNNVGYLGMCGHGAIGLMATLKWLGRIESGVHRLETPVGVVTCELSDSGW